ncbi:MAG: hypothetical protein Q9165_002046 [Trypethelium subeluteriae]
MQDRNGKLSFYEGRKSSEARYKPDNLRTSQSRTRESVIVQPFDEARLTAKGADSVLRPTELNLFTSTFTVITAQKPRDSGIGIVYKTSSGFVERAYHDDQLNHPFTAGLVAFADALDIALAKIQTDEETSAAEGRLHTFVEDVTVLTEDVDVLELVGYASDRQIQQNAVLARAFMTATVLDRMGVQVYVEWIPEYSRIRGYLRARDLARQAAGRPGMDLGCPLSID